MAATPAANGQADPSPDEDRCEDTKFFEPLSNVVQDDPSILTPPPRTGRPEKADDLLDVIFVLNSCWRVISGRGGIQWIVQQPKCQWKGKAPGRHQPGRPPKFRQRRYRTKPATRPVRSFEDRRE